MKRNFEEASILQWQTVTSNENGTVLLIVYDLSQIVNQAAMVEFVTEFRWKYASLIDLLSECLAGNVSAA